MAPIAAHPAERQSVLSGSADRERAWGDRCLSLVQPERYDEAIADCSRAIQLDGHRLEHRLNRGVAFYRTGNFHYRILTRLWRSIAIIFARYLTTAAPATRWGL
ncbi:MAG: hypothetical protein HC873_15680 [Leptolyngbyaceae cyanobacterium SL_1_1]|nr:hypothetical protein [Leptolyngbyaceae cyanobacterium SL_1_1]